MTEGRKPNRLRRPTNVSLAPALVQEAQELGIAVSRACEEGLGRAIAEARRAKWKADNREAIEALNRDIETNGLLMAKYRPF
jgi:antitoxin CcdA